MTRVARPLAGLFAADAISTTGTEMTAVALPWFVLVSTHSPTRMGAVLAAEFVGMTVLGLWGGPVATRLGARRMMLAADLIRAVLIALVPFLYRVGALSFPALLAVGFAVGGFFPAYASSERLVLAGIVGGDELRNTRAGGLKAAVNETASFVGPAFGGALVALIGAANVLLVDAVSYLCAFALVAALVPAARVPVDPAEEETGVLPGLRYLVRHPVLRRQVIGIGVIELGWSAMIATLPVLALHGGGGPSLAGWLLAAFGGGSVVGGLISSRARGIDGRTGTWSVAGMAMSTWLFLVPVPAWGYVVAVAANGVANGLFMPRFFAALTTRTPPAVRARVMTSVHIAISAPGPVGFLGAGILAQRTGATTASTLLIVGATTLGAAITIRARGAATVAVSPG